MDTLTNMRIFVRVVDSGSFTAAAHAMQLTIAYVSRAVADLETQLRTRLLHRTTRRIALTGAGERYLQRARQILADVDEAQAEVRDAQVRASGTLRVHAMTSFAQRYLIPAISRYRLAHPEVSVELTLSQRVPDLLDEGYDVALVLGSEPTDSGMIAQRLGAMHSIVCAAPDYLSAHGEPTRPEEVSAHPCLQLISALFPLDKWVFEPEGGGARRTVTLPDAVFRVNVAEAMSVAIAEGMGIGLLPSYAALAGLKAGTLRRVLCGYRLQAMSVYAVYPSRRHIDAKTRTWVDFIQKALPEAMQRDIAELESLREAV